MRFNSIESFPPCSYPGSEDPPPNAATKMDISTGHMVLAYMEDHLKNKQRLEQEWVALCGDEAEPCATTIAFKVCKLVRWWSDEYIDILRVRIICSFQMYFNVLYHVLKAENKKKNRYPDKLPYDHNRV